MLIICPIYDEFSFSLEATKILRYWGEFKKSSQKKNQKDSPKQGYKSFNLYYKIL